MKRIVVIGGGLAGLNFIDELANQDQFEIILVDKNTYNFSPPLIYQVSSGLVEPSAISFPFRKFLRKKNNVTFRLSDVTKVDTASKKVFLSDGELSYDMLVFATGTTSNYFGMANIEKYALPMKTINEAIAIRNRVLERLEEAVRTDNQEERQKLLTFVVTGGGPSGVEISGMLNDVFKSLVPTEYPELKGTTPLIYLVEGMGATLGPMSVKSQKESQKALEDAGVKVLLNTQVQDCTEDSIMFADGNSIATKNIIWTAGVIALAFDGIPTEAYGRGRRMIVDGYNKVIGLEDIYALGDTCIMPDVEKDPKYAVGHPQVAQVAIQQGVNLAKNLKKQVNGNLKTKTFAYKDKGSMAYIRKHKAVVDFTNGWFCKGFIGWFLWLAVHAMTLEYGKNIRQSVGAWISSFYFSVNPFIRLNYREGEKKN